MYIYVYIYIYPFYKKTYRYFVFRLFNKDENCQETACYSIFFQRLRYLNGFGAHG